ncbi:lysophospholipid acyltransferase family protein [Actinomyces vulturis]|uniref:lysophospholipid acyltransferase family protein n=1 Tax=Actinomyces vulturis TaxID=1857645 RepID=UPI001FDFE46D|nr:lysophospholipid acyltransferase family protein [Actinomyces vulturis]
MMTSQSFCPRDAWASMQSLGTRTGSSWPTSMGQTIRSIVTAPPKVTWRAIARQKLWATIIAPFGGVHVRGKFADGPFVVVVNHNSHADTIAMMAASPTIMRTVTVAAQDYWFTRRSRRFIARSLLGAYPVRRDGEGAYEELRDSLAPRVAESMSVLIFPEGSRDHDSDEIVGPFHSGAARLARDFGIPILPVALVGSKELMPRHARLPRYCPIEVRVGQPITPSHDVCTVSEQARQQIIKMLDAPRSSFPVSNVHATIAQIHQGKRGDILSFVWGFTEALSFPIMAEMCQVWLGVTDMSRLTRRGAFITAGSVCGVALTHTLAHRGHFLPAPWTTEKMRRHTRVYLHKGPQGYWAQALTGIPVKVFARESGRAQMPLGRVLLHCAGERAVRMGVSTALIRALNKPIGDVTRQHYGKYLVTTGTVFGVALTKIVRHWSR